MNALLRALIVPLALAQAPAGSPSQPAPASEPEVEALRQELAQERQREADAAALAARNAERVAALQQHLAAIEERGRAIEASRVERAEAYGKSSGALSKAQAILVDGTTDVAFELDSAEQALTLAADAAGRFGGEQERADAFQALDAIEGARAALAQGDLYQARLDLVFAADSSSRAQTVAMASAHPLFRAGGP
jgi:SWI/SNF-related matrix-associated actin-dependent regulator 1 of chromatin subfamily A